MRTGSQIPKAAALLGTAGALPLVLGAIGFWTLPPEAAAHALDAQVFYGVTALTFLGAVHWGTAIADGAAPDRLWARLGWGMTPALIAWLAALLAAVPALVTLMLGIGASHLMDLRACRRGDLPEWYTGLRRRTNAVALLALGASLLRLV